MDIKSKKIEIFKPKKNKKNKIVLCNSYNFKLNHLNIRYKGYQHIPHYTVLKNGTIYQHLEDELSTSIIDNESIIVYLENWGELSTQKEHLYSIYNEEPFEKEREWRGFRFFDKYSEEQVNSTSELVSSIIKEHGIRPQCMHNNILIKGDTFYGVYYRANFDKKYLDLSPAFPFEEFKKRIDK